MTLYRNPRLLPTHRVGLLALALMLASCAGYQDNRDGQSELAKGHAEQGLAKLKQATEKSPHDLEYRQDYFTQLEATVNTLLRRAEMATTTGDFDAARDAYGQVLRVDPSNTRAADGARRADAAQRQWQHLDAALALASTGDVQAAVAKTQEVLSEDPTSARATTLLKQLMRQQADATGRELGIYPKLKASYRMPVSLSFNNASLLQVFESLKQASGLNYVFDKDVHTDTRVTLAVTAKPVEDILRLLLATNQLEQRVLDEDTLLIYPNTPAKLAEYREMIVRTFYLRHTEASKMAEMLKTIVRARDVVVDDKLNLLTVRDSANVIRMVEKLIAAQDLAEPEVMLDLEVIEVSTTQLENVGITWPSSISASVSGAAGVPGQLTPSEARHFNSGLIKLNIGNPLAAAQLSAQVGGAKLLANPRIRVRNKLSAKVLIGERVPVFTTTATANVGSTESVNYLDVGLKLDIEPTISLDDEVSMKLALEVSNIINTVTSPTGTQAYLLGTRNTSTTLQVHDGETNILAGLIQDQDQHTNTGLPGLNQLPLLDKLFGSSQDTNNRTEIILLVTPHVIRNIELPGVGLQEFTSGTDAAMGAAPIQLGAPAPGALESPRPNMQHMPGQAPTSHQPAPPRPAIPTAPAGAASAPANVPPAFTPPPLVPTSSQDASTNGE